ncbi:MAG: Nif3-like dinuclear metal center hexameric protein [Candidatus Baldrarchaeia archaeon]
MAMVTMDEVIKKLDELAPRDLALEGDVIGLQVSSRAFGRLSNVRVRGVGVIVYPTYLAVSKCLEKGANLIISHHPLPLHLVARYGVQPFAYRTLALLLSNKAYLFVLHSNWLSAESGISESLSEVLNFEVIGTLNVRCGTRNIPIGRICRFERSCNLRFLAQYISHRLGDVDIYYTGMQDEDVGKIGVVGGCIPGHEFLIKAYNSGVDTIVTGEYRYEDAVLASELGLKLIAVGRYESERPGMVRLSQILQLEFPSIKVFFVDERVPRFHVRVS